MKMFRLAFSLFGLFVWTLCEIVVIKKQKDKIYSGHVLFEVSMPMWSICAQFCSRVKMCKSINFIIWNKTCQINDDEPGGCNDELIESVGNSFAAASTFPQDLAGPCRGHDCKLNEVCLPKEMNYSCIPWFSQMSKRTYKKDIIEVLHTIERNHISPNLFQCLYGVFFDQYKPETTKFLAITNKQKLHQLVKDFRQIFVTCSGIQQSVLDTWRNPSLGEHIGNNGNSSCTNRHLRRSMIDNWDSSRFDQVKVEVFRNGTLVVEVYFDGRGSTSSDWFTKERLCSSSFNDMNQMSTFNYFSMDGLNDQGRHFYISHTNGGCSNDKSWIVVIDKFDQSPRYCKYDRMPGKAYPYILYGPDHHMIKFETEHEEVAVADMMAISVSTLV